MRRISDVYAIKNQERVIYRIVKARIQRLLGSGEFIWGDVPQSSCPYGPQLILAENDLAKHLYRSLPEALAAAPTKQHFQQEKKWISLCAQPG